MKKLFMIVSLCSIGTICAMDQSEASSENNSELTSENNDELSLTESTSDNDELPLSDLLAEANCYRGITLQCLGKITEAKKYFTNASIIFDSPDIQIYSLAQLARFDMHCKPINLPLAKASIKQAEKIEAPNSIATLLLLIAKGEFKQRNNKRQKAQTIFQDALNCSELVTQEPFDGMINYYRGEIFEYLGKTEEAINEYQIILKDMALEASTINKLWPTKALDKLNDLVLSSKNSKYLKESLEKEELNFSD